MAAVLTNKGIAKIVSALLASGLGTVYLALGTGAGTASPTDIAMFNEDTTLGRVIATTSAQTNTVTGDTLQASATFNFTVAKTYTEIGLWDASTGGNLLYHRDGVAQTVVSNGVNSETFNEQIIE